MTYERRHASLSDLELVTLAESLPVFQRDGIEREVLQRLARAASHSMVSSDLGALKQSQLDINRRRFNGR
jgi:hypothetical protein